MVVLNDPKPEMGIIRAQQLGLGKLEYDNLEKVFTIYNSAAFDDGVGWTFCGEN